MGVTGVKKILLPQMADIRAHFARDVQMIIDDEADARAFGDRKNLLRQPPDFVRGRMFGAQLDEITAALAELLRHELGRTALQIGRVHKGVKLAIRQRFHRPQFTGIFPGSDGNIHRH